MTLGGLLAVSKACHTVTASVSALDTMSAIVRAAGSGSGSVRCYLDTSFAKHRLLEKVRSSGYSIKSQLGVL